MTSLATAGLATAGTLAAAAYLDAKYLIRHDLGRSPFSNGPMQAMKFFEERVKEDKLAVFDIFERHATNQPNYPFMIFEGRTYTYKQFFNSIIRVANWLLRDLGVQRGEIVALDGGNSPEYVMIYLAIESIGAATAYINSNLSGRSLEHCVSIASARYLIAEDAVRSLVSPSEKNLYESNLTRTIYYSSASIASLTNNDPLPRDRRTGTEPSSIRSLIYTSGTTGLPKATIMSTQRHLVIGHSVSSYLKFDRSHILYTCLPLYHGAAQGLGVAPTIHAGSTIALGRKFSHRTFWPEVRASGAVTIQYIGELCRYLLNAPHHPDERNHRVQMAWGNGMRPDVWEPFRQRLGVQTINELYAATDGMGFTFNDNRGEFGRNAIGVRGLLWHLVMGKREMRVKIDPDTQEMLRDSDGFAIKCGTDEPGEVIHVVEEEMLRTIFPGYFHNQDATDKRVIRDVFKKGDLYFRSGDMMRVDTEGRVFFVDRLGDTFRWKSENVSTNEVADIVGQFHQIAESNVYGVAVPHADGRCGAAALVLKDGVTPQTLDLKGLANHVLERLPRYAVPVFVRVAVTIEYTTTMKMQKGRLRNEGADMGKLKQGGTGDVVFWLPPGENVYKEYKEGDWEALKSGKVKL